MIALSRDDTLAQPAPTMASPQWWGADSHRSRQRATDSGTTVFVKTLTVCAQTYIDVASSFAVTTAVGEAALGPRVLDADVTEGWLVMDDLTETHSTASLADFGTAERRSALIRTRRAVWDLTVPEAREQTVFDDVRSLHDQLTTVNAYLPKDVAWMLNTLAEAELRISETHYDLALIHGDANSSNVAIDRSTGAIALLDHDWATRADPIQDVGSLILELAFGRDDAEELFEEAWGDFDPRLFARAQCYAAAEAVRGGLIGAWADHCDPGTLEYSKFSDWMFSWARTAIGDRRMDDYLRRLA